MGSNNYFDVIKALLHTLVRFMPLSLYSFSYLSVAIYKDLRSAILLLGLVLNDIIGLVISSYRPENKPNESCAIFQRIKETNLGKETKLGFLPNTHTEIISFVAGFYFTDMHTKGKIDLLPFWFLISLIVVTLWSRMTVLCKSFRKGVFNIAYGVLFGFIYYKFMQPYYNSVEKGIYEKETCDLGYRNYKCDTIKDGTVIVKNTGNENKENEEEETLNSYYD
mgnify:FL=1